jgi:hypothetical protein
MLQSTRDELSQIQYELRRTKSILAGLLKVTGNVIDNNGVVVPEKEWEKNHLFQRVILDNLTTYDTANYITTKSPINKNLVGCKILYYEPFKYLNVIEGIVNGVSSDLTLIKVDHVWINVSNIIIKDILQTPKKRVKNETHSKNTKTRKT